MCKTVHFQATELPAITHTGGSQLSDLPQRRVATPTRCHWCETLIPAHTWAGVLRAFNDALLCSSQCVNKMTMALGWETVSTGPPKAPVETLRQRKDELDDEIGSIEMEMDDLRDRKRELEDQLEGVTDALAKAERVPARVMAEATATMAGVV